MRSILFVAAVVAVGACSSASAGGPAVARLVGVSGNVLVSTDSGIASASEALRLAPGMRVLVTLNSAATVQYNGGCRVRLRAGERLEIRGDQACADRGMTAIAGLVPAAERRR